MVFSFDFSIQALDKLYIYSFLRWAFSVALEPVLKLPLVDQAGLKLREMCLPLPSTFNFILSDAAHV